MSKKNIYSHIIIAFFIFVSNCFAASDLPYEEGKLLVRFVPKANSMQRSTNERNQILAALSAGTVKHSVKLVPGLSLVELPENLTVTDALPKFKGKNEIMYVEPNWKISPASTCPNDPNLNLLWALNNTGQIVNGTAGTPGADINAFAAWDIRTDSNVVVAVIDSGVDYNHPDLRNNMWTDANGLYGYDFCTYGGKQEDPDPMDDLGHGTHVAGIVGAQGNNGLGVVGACWHVKIMALKFMSDSNNQGSGYTYDAIKCIDYAVDNGAKILNASWGWSEDSYHFIDPNGPPGSGFNSLKNAIEYANAHGVLFVAAAGNRNYDVDNPPPNYFPFYPACYDCSNIITVLNTNQNDIRTGQPFGSNYGHTSVDIGAPGKNILSCYPVAMGSYAYDSGTSMSSPYVAGACALVWAENPGFTNLQVKYALMESADALASLSGLCVTGGRLNLYKALTACHGDFNNDGTVNFKDYAIFAEAWQTHTSDANWNPACDLIQDGVIDCNDLQLFAGFWLIHRSGFATGLEDEQMMMDEEMDEEGPPPLIYLVYDGNQPCPSDEVTVWIQTDGTLTPISALGVFMNVVGDVNILSTTVTEDCNTCWGQSYIEEPTVSDANGWVQVGGIVWPDQIGPGNIGFFKFIYNSGQVSIWIDSSSIEMGTTPVQFSTDTLVIGSDPNE